jgi:hypothetical protein
MDIANEYAEDRESLMSDFIITRETKIKTKQQIEKEKQFKDKNGRIDEDTKEYYHLLEQMADRGDPEAAVEIA